MIEISEGFTSIAMSTDRLMPSRRAPTGVRVTLEFSRDDPLPPGQKVRVRYDAVGDGTLREGSGVAQPTRSVARWGAGVVYHYRLSLWIEPAALMQLAPGNVRQRTERLENPPQYPANQTSVVA